MNKEHRKWPSSIFHVCTFLLALCSAAKTVQAADSRGSLRPPSVPLVACDPYFSIWSPADKLTDADTVHWTGKPHHLHSYVKIDDKPYLMVMGKVAELPALPQTGVEVWPTRTVSTFEGEGVRLTLTFMTAALPDDLMIYSRPVTYVAWTAESTDGKEHNVSARLHANGQLVVNASRDAVAGSKGSMNGLAFAKLGSTSQAVLARKGDDLRIEWGYLYVAVPESDGSCGLIGPESQSEQQGPDLKLANEVSGEAERCQAVATLTLGKVGQKAVSRHVILAYDDEYSIQYFKHNLRPFWRRNGDDAAALLKKAAAEYESLKKRCEKFDADLMKALTKAGGEKYAKLCALAYRQCYAANKVVADANGQPLMFPKENFSNGCIGTVDVIYPMAPQFLLFSPSLAKAMLVPILDYAASTRWRWPFAPHDLGTYPLANGQVYGGGERTEQNQMPVEETGNMLIMLAALAQVEGNADFCAKYWPILGKWADYLKAKGFDPENQLCTDDFAGHLAHNVNLSAKAICGLGAYAKLCEMRGEKAKAKELMALAKDFAGRWVKEADDGDHSRLAFDKAGTWSQKYNLVWDRILGLNLFPTAVARKELAFYKTKQNDYGLPLDVRKAYTKLDWTLWTATLTQDHADFAALLDPVYRFLNESPSRVPMTDWYDTKTARMVGFQARSVVGGVFLQMLYDRGAWKKWAGCDTTKAANWAPFPKPPKVVPVVATSETKGLVWHYTTEAQSDGWYKPDFDASGWKEGPGGFGTKGTPGAIVRTEWKTQDIWLQREFTLSDGKWSDLELRIHHDDDAEVYLNGVLAVRLRRYLTDYDNVPMNAQARQALKPGKNVMSVHCHQTVAGQYIDVGLVDVQVQE